MRRLTTDEIYKKRLEKNKLRAFSAICSDENEKENENPKFKVNNTKNATSKVSEQEIHKIEHNPFNLASHMRLFTLRKSEKKSSMPEPFITNDPRTICDIDKTFYKIIEGRPLRQFSDIKVYMRNIRDITLFRANIAYRRDQIIKIDTALRDEYTEYEKIDTFFTETKSNFVRFAQECYERGKIVEALANAKSIELDKMVDQLENYSFICVKIRNQLSGLLATFENLDKYRGFLFSLSPMSWQNKFMSHFNENIIDVNYLQENITSAETINGLKVTLLKLQKVSPELFFDEPKQLMTICDDLGKQCLNYMKINVFANNIIVQVMKYRGFYRKIVQDEVFELEEFIEIFQKYVVWMEDKEKENKAIFERILLNEFHELFASYDTAKLFTCVQYVNTRLFETPEDPKDSLSLLTGQLELQYLELTSQLDCLDQEIVKAATNELFAEDIKMMKMAHKAQRELKECDLLSKALYTSFEPPRYKRK
ncbi:uncharacterized protein LOC101738897 [Bombyx mori]|uniref:Uncharacterized protein n=1 Tax=Bombyx mori TaxID=7091 RepID=A0A8R2GB85_BOMMO|nr:uncharacterized protein LOC101738897 [Bombyx mori]